MIDSCQHEQTIKPSAAMNDLECSSSTPSSNASLSDSTSTNSIEPNETPTNKIKRKIFVLENKARKKSENQKNVDSASTSLSATINDIKESLSNYNSNKLLEFLKEESAKQARRHEMFLNLMSELINNN